VVDYLLKPISFERFLKAALKAKAVLEPVAVSNVDTAIASATANNFIFIKTHSRIVNVSLNDILFIEGLKDYIAINTVKEKLITLESLKTLEETLPKNRFVRVHKSYIVAIEKIDSIERNRIFIKDAVIPVGDTYKENFLKMIGEG
jgi:two-component system LytT family response regulator